MSFILGALNKDQPDADADTLTARIIADDRHSRWRWLLWFVVIALLANLLIVSFLFSPWGDTARARIGDLISGNEPASAGSSQPAAPPRASASTPSSTTAPLVRPRERTGPNRPGVQTSQRPSRAQTASRATTATTTRPGDGPATPSGGGPGRVLTPEQAAALNIPLPEQTAATAADSTVAAEPVTAQPEFDATAAAPAPTTAAAAPAPAQQTNGPGPVAGTATKSRLPDTIALEELSPKDRAEFPKLEFSTHIFADDPTMRAVVVNSKRLVEGESIGEMVLRAVTEDGIVVDYRGQRVAVSVLDSWEE